MRRSEKFLEIQAAMLKARPAFEPLKKTKENKHFGSKYADLEGAIDASIKALTDNGLLLIQSPGMYDETNRSITLTSFLSHTSGEWFEDDFQMPVPKADPQGVGTAISYARRYAQLAMFNLAAEDDDGNHASGTAEKAEIRKPQALRPTDTTIAPQKTTRVFDTPKAEYEHGADKYDRNAPQFDYSGKHPLPPEADPMPVNDPPRANKHEWIQKTGNISQPQAKRIFGIGKGRGKSNDWIREFLGSHGYTETNEIPKGEVYTKICSELEIA